MFFSSSLVTRTQMSCTQTQQRQANNMPTSWTSVSLRQRRLYTKPNPLSPLLSGPVKTLASARRTVMSSTNYLWQDRTAALHQFSFLFERWTLSHCIASLSRGKHEPTLPAFNPTVFGDNWPPLLGTGIKWWDHTAASSKKWQRLLPNLSSCAIP